MRGQEVSRAGGSHSDLFINIGSTSEAICTLQHNSSAITKPNKQTNKKLKSTSCTFTNFACEASIQTSETDPFIQYHLLKGYSFKILI